MSRIVTYVHRPKRKAKRKKPAAMPAGTPVIVTARKRKPAAASVVSASKPGKPRYEPDPGPASESVKAFFARMIRPPDR
jgi:hypothetical protein